MLHRFAVGVISLTLAAIVLLWLASLVEVAFSLCVWWAGLIGALLGLRLVVMSWMSDSFSGSHFATTFTRSSSIVLIVAAGASGAVVAALFFAGLPLAAGLVLANTIITTGIAIGGVR